MHLFVLLFCAEISLYSWHEGKKLVKMVLGSVPKQHSEGDRPHPADTRSGTGGLED